MEGKNISLFCVMYFLKLFRLYLHFLKNILSFLALT
jgi:hypothetical protein